MQMCTLLFVVSFAGSGVSGICGDGFVRALSRKILEIFVFNQFLWMRMEDFDMPLDKIICIIS